LGRAISIHLRLIIKIRVKPIFSSITQLLLPPTLRLPCGDLAPLTELQLDLLITSLDGVPLDWLDGQCVQGAGTYSANDDDVRLLGIPASRGRVTALDLNWARF